MSDLEEVYKKTTYIVYTSEKTINIRIGEKNKDLDLFLEKYNNDSWVFITAYNPCSKKISDEENKLRHLELIRDLKAYVVFTGEGKPDSADWDSEISLFVIGLEDEILNYLAKKYQQNAVVIGNLDTIPELKFFKKFPIKNPT